MNTQAYTIRKAIVDEFLEIGQLMLKVYSNLDGFPKPTDLPEYYDLLTNVGRLTKKTGTEIMIAVSSYNEICGAVVFFSEITHYGASASITKEQNASGFRLLAVVPAAQGNGIGKLLVNACINKARELNRDQLIIHTTMAMQTAWKMYEKLGFNRSEDLTLNKEI